MSTTERIYALLVEANPVLDPDTLAPRGGVEGPGFHVVGEDGFRRPARRFVPRPTPKPARRLGWIAALVTAFVVVGLVSAGAIVFRRDTTRLVSDTPVASRPVTESVADAEARERVDSALAKVEAFQAALNAGDLDTIATLSSPDEADLAMWNFNTMFTALYPREVRGCESSATTDVLVIINCSVVVHDPVFVAGGISELTEPWWIYDDGRMQWRPWDGADFSQANRDYRDYLLLHHPDKYAEFCDPLQYEFGSINSDSGFALTGDCAGFAVTVAPEVAAWIRAGRPDS